MGESLENLIQYREEPDGRLTIHPRVESREAYCRCDHGEAAHRPRKPGGYDLCQASGCFCVEFHLWGFRERSPA